MIINTNNKKVFENNKSTEFKRFIQWNVKTIPLIPIKHVKSKQQQEKEKKKLIGEIKRRYQPFYFNKEQDWYPDLGTGPL